jgi:mannose/fructose/N-acetylgalactosamine-specific phosphotransferase system component IIC
MFVLALVAILILGVIVVGLLWLLSKSISNQRNQSRQEPKTTPSGVNPEQGGNEQLAILIRKIDDYHDKDTKRSLADRFERLMCVLWGFALTISILAFTVSNIPRTNWTISLMLTVSIIVTVGFAILAIGATKKYYQYRPLKLKDFWGDKTY